MKVAMNGSDILLLRQGAIVQPASGSSTDREPVRIPWMLGACLFLAIAVFFLWEEHRAHILGALPYLLLLLCPVVHLFMHRRHDRHDPDAGHDGHTQQPVDGALR